MYQILVLFYVLLPWIHHVREEIQRQQSAQSFITKPFDNHSKIVLNFKPLKDGIGEIVFVGSVLWHLIYFARMKILGKSLRKVSEGNQEARGMWMRK